jgi:hypothetical protein
MVQPFVRNVQALNTARRVERMDNEHAQLVARSAGAMIEALGMISENIQRDRRGESLAYSDKDFTNVITGWGLGWNDIAMTGMPQHSEEG